MCQFLFSHKYSYYCLGIFKLIVHTHGVKLLKRYLDYIESLILVKVGASCCKSCAQVYGDFFSAVAAGNIEFAHMLDILRRIACFLSKLSCRADNRLLAFVYLARRNFKERFFAGLAVLSYHYHLAVCCYRDKRHGAVMLDYFSVGGFAVFNRNLVSSAV